MDTVGLRRKQLSSTVAHLGLIHPLPGSPARPLSGAKWLRSESKSEGRNIHTRQSRGQLQG